MSSNRPTVLIWRQLKDRWRYRGIHARKFAPRRRTHPRQLARLRAHADDVLLVNGVETCRSCWRTYTRGHVCPFPEEG